MTYVIAAALLVVGVATLTLPWSRRDPADFSLVELGYAWRGPRGAMAGALRALVDLGVARRTRHSGVVRTDEPLPSGTDKLLRAIYSGMSTPRGPAALLDLPSVEKELAPVADRVLGARLRVGPARRAIGSLAAMAAPVTALVALINGDGEIVTGIALGVVALIVFGWLVSLRGVTIAGLRTLGVRPRSAARSGAGGGMSEADIPLRVLIAELGATSGGFGAVVSDAGSGGGGD